MTWTIDTDTQCSVLSSDCMANPNAPNVTAITGNIFSVAIVQQKWQKTLLQKANKGYNI